MLRILAAQVLIMFVPLPSCSTTRPGSPLVTTQLPGEASSVQENFERLYHDHELWKTHLEALEK